MGDGTYCHYCRKYPCECTLPTDIRMLFLSGDAIREIADLLHILPAYVEITLREWMRETVNLRSARVVELERLLQEEFDKSGKLALALVNSDVENERLRTALESAQYFMNQIIGGVTEALAQTPKPSCVCVCRCGARTPKPEQV